MSMISSLIDELRKSADEWNRSNMFELARMCHDAANTIWELRDDLQRANAENARLREQSERLFDKTLELATENAKLRELMREAIYARDDADWASIVSTAIALGVEVDG